MRSDTQALNRLSSEVAKIRDDLKSRKDVLALTNDIVELKERLADLKVQESVVKEKHARETREVQHFVGLEKKRQEVELDQATREAKLDVREENLKADKERFDSHVKFVEDRMNTHLGDMKDLLTSVMERIPTVTVDKAAPK